MYGKVRPRKLHVFNNSIVYCRVNKCASTFTLNTLNLLFGSSNNAGSDHEFAKQNNTTMKHIYHSIDSKYSFYFVREPYRRLFSTYCNKFYLPKEHWAPIGPDIARLYKRQPSSDSLQFGHDVTFKELIQYTVDKFEKGYELDQHLRPMHELCNPCRYKYSFVGRLETLHSDWKTMIQTWKPSGLVNSYVSSSSDIYNNTHLGEVKHCFKTINLTMNSTISPDNLLHRTWSYYQAVGHISKHIPMPFTKDKVCTVNMTSYREAIEIAMEKSKVYGKKVAEQRNESLMQAYSTIPDELLERLRNVVLVDCLMFGYDDRPDWLFGKQSNADIKFYDYFKHI